MEGLFMLDKLVQITAGGIGALCAVLWGGLDGVLYALLIFIVLDFITGVLIGISTKKLSSEVGFKGICKKVTILALVAVANIIDQQVLHTHDMLRTATCFFYIANEGISLLENAGKLGLPLPPKLKDILVQLSEHPDEPVDTPKDTEPEDETLPKDNE